MLLCRINLNKLKRFKTRRLATIDRWEKQGLLGDDALVGDSRTFMVHVGKQPTQEEIVDIILKIREFMRSQSHP